MRRLNRVGGWVFWLVLATGLLVAVAPLAAQEEATQEAAESEAEGEAVEETGEPRREIEEIMVTARRREESLEEVPQAVSVITQEGIENLFAASSADLTKVSPNLIFDNVNAASPRAGGLALRGVSFQDVEPSFDPAVGVVLDEVYLATNIGQVFQLMDLERIEVLRGPQGTLFGKNTIGGVINVVTERPTSDRLGGMVRGLYGEYSRGEFDGIVNVPMGDKFAAKLALTTRTRDGYTFNRFSGQDEGELDFQSASIDLLWNPTDRVELFYGYERTDDDTDQVPTLNVSQPIDLLCIVFAQCASSETEPSTGDRWTADVNGSNSGKYDVDFHIFKARWDVNDRYSLKYILGYRDSFEDMDTDWDGSPVDFFSGENRITELEQTSNEFQLTYTGNRLKYTAGLYLWEADYVLTQDTKHFFNVLWLIGALGPLPIPPGDQVELTDHRTDSEALFFQADYNFSDRWTLTFGGRYTTEEKAMTKATGWENYGGLDTAIVLDTRDLNPHDEWSKFTPKLGLRYQIDPDSMTYLTYSSGFRSGGYNGRAATTVSATVPYDPETVDSLEWGYKSEFFDRLLRFNAAVFFSEYSDKQEELIAVLPAGQETIVKNAAEVDISGVELELLALPTEGLRLGLNLGFLDAEYVDFDADLNGDGVITDNTFLELRRAPDFNLTFHLNYGWSLGPGRMSVDGTYRYSDDYFLTILNDAIGKVDAYGVLDASISYDWKIWRFSVFGNNLTDEDYYTHAFALPGLWRFAYPRPPTMWGGQVSVRF